MRTHKTEVYTFDELTDEAKEKALDACRFWNVEYLEWWESVYEDAKEIGLEIEGFDIDRGSYCRGKLLANAVDIAEAVLQRHGKDCETYKDAKAFLDNIAEKELSGDEYDDYLESGEHNENAKEFLSFMWENYRIILQKEYEYLTSDEAVKDSIEANEIEFTKDGKRF